MNALEKYAAKRKLAGTPSPAQAKALAEFMKHRKNEIQKLKSTYEEGKWAANVTEGAGKPRVGKERLWRAGGTKRKYEKQAARAGIDKLFYSPATTKVESLLRYARGNPAKKEILRELEATYGKNRVLWPKASGSSTPQQKLVEGRRRAALTSLLKGRKQ